MLSSFNIRNYRGFKDFTIEPLDRINLIAGSNNVGKTSLLEALYINLTPGAALYSNYPVINVRTRHGSIYFGDFRKSRGELITKQSLAGYSTKEI